MHFWHCSVGKLLAFTHLYHTMGLSMQAACSFVKDRYLLRLNQWLDVIVNDHNATSRPEF